MRFSHLGSRSLRSAFVCTAVLVATSAIAAGSSFIERLSPDEKAACGIAKLTAAQTVVLGSLVERDATLARQGEVTGFSTTFTERCTPQERADAGINRLSGDDRASLDALVAHAIATRPAQSEGFAYSPPAKPASVPTDTLVSRPFRTEVHGDLSLTVGAGSHGSSFYGTSADLFVTDPSGKYTIGIGVSEYRGRGYFPVCDPIFLDPPLRD